MPTPASAPETQTYHPPSLKPAISPRVELSLTIVYTTLYGSLFLVVYLQLWMSLYFKHKRFSYQSVFLFLCLLWAGLRTTLFSFYFNDAVGANNLETFFYWLLYCCPVCLQFITLCLLVVFFTQVLFKARGRLGRFVSPKYKLLVWQGVGAAILVFLVTNITCAIIDKQNDAKSSSTPFTIPMVRVVINDSLFIIFGISLAVCLYRMSKMQSTSHVLEAKGLTVKQSVVMGTFIILLYISRALYNMAAISKPLSHMINFGYGWINVSDQAEFSDLRQGTAYVSFGIVLFVWEFLPTAIVVIYFRVQKPSNSVQSIPSLSPDGSTSRAFFFDNPRRYDSEDDLTAHSFPSTQAGNSEVFESSSPYSINHAASTTSQTQHGLSGASPEQLSNHSNHNRARLQPPEAPTIDYYDGT